jgi:1-acyl-sn-glycerol-3-phosphate acyltransferase
MQAWGFIFLARSWAADRLYLVRQLMLLGREAEKRDTPFIFLLYPEGTLVSKDTRPISKKYAEKIGVVCPTVPEYVHFLLMRPYS